MPTLSIVIPVYNEQDHLQTCLEAIAAQTVMPDEVIVVDNNSSDRSAGIAARYPFVTVVRETKQGIAHARNAGFNAATTSLIGRIDADTILPDTWVEHVLELYGSGDDFALTGSGYFYNVSLPRFNSLVTTQIAFRMNRFIMGHYILWGSNMVLPRRYWAQVRDGVCSANGYIHEDLDLAIHLHRLGCPITFKEKLMVGVEMKRAFSADKTAFRANLALWPETLYAHGLKRAWLGKLGAGFLYWGTMLFMKPAEKVIRTFKSSRQQVRSLLSFDTEV